jgi:hypothetical protein
MTVFVRTALAMGCLVGCGAAFSVHDDTVSDAAADASAADAFDASFDAPPCEGPDVDNPDTCPAAFSTAASGSPCSAVGLWCSYPGAGPYEEGMKCNRWGEIVCDGDDGEVDAGTWSADYAP